MSLPTTFFIGRGSAAEADAEFLPYLTTQFSAKTSWTNVQISDFGGHLTNKQPIGGTISRYGTKCFTSNYAAGSVSQIQLGTPWDLSSYTSAQEFTTIGGITMGSGWNLSGIFWSEDGQYCLITTRANNNTYTNANVQFLFRVATDHAYDLNYATYVDRDENLSTNSGYTQAVNGASMSRDGRYYAWSHQNVNSLAISENTPASNYFTLNGGSSNTTTSVNLSGQAYNILGMTHDHSGRNVYYGDFGSTPDQIGVRTTNPWSVSLGGETLINLPTVDVNGTTVTRQHTCVGGVLANEGYGVLTDYDSGSSTNANFQLYQIS